MKVCASPLFAIIFCVLIASCAKDKASVMPEEVTVSLWLGQDSVYKPERNEQVIKVVSGDKNIVQATVKDGGVLISAVKSGSTTVHITNELGKESMISVNSEDLFHSIWRTGVGGSPKMAIKVVGDNPLFVEELKEEILDEAEQHFELTLHDKISQKFSKNIMHFDENEIEVVKREGTFTFEHLILTLNLADGKEIYKVIPYPNRKLIGLEQDLTNYFQTLYPAQVIKKVIVKLHLTKYTLPG